MKISGALLIGVLNAAWSLASPVASAIDLSSFDVPGVAQGPVQKAAADSIRSLNWAGASTAGTNITSVTGVTTVPRIKLDKDGWTTGMAIFAGIDGYFTCPNSMLIAGIIVAAQQGYASNFTAFWRWTPHTGGSDNQVGFPIWAGHKIRLTVTLLSPTTSIGYVENLSTGQIESRYFEAPEPLCGTDASWVVGRYSSLGPLMGWPEFLDPVIISGASATTGAGDKLDLTNADLLDIEEQSTGRLLTNCAILNSSSLTCAHA